MAVESKITPQDIIELAMWTLLMHPEPSDEDTCSCAAAAVKALTEYGWLKAGK